MSFAAVPNSDSMFKPFAMRQLLGTTHMSSTTCDGCDEANDDILNIIFRMSNMLSSSVLILRWSLPTGNLLLYSLREGLMMCLLSKSIWPAILLVL